MSLSGHNAIISQGRFAHMCIYCIYIIFTLDHLLLYHVYVYLHPWNSVSHWESIVSTIVIIVIVIYACLTPLVFLASTAWCTVPSHPPMITHATNSIVFFLINLVFNWKIIPYRILLFSAKPQHAPAIGTHMSPPS